MRTSLVILTAVAVATLGFAFVTEPAQASACIVGYNDSGCIVNIDCIIECCQPGYCCYPYECADP